MKILTKYFIKEFFKPLVFSSASFGLLVLISEFFRELNFYLEKKASFLDVFAYLALNLPWWIIQSLPVAVLLAVLFSLGKFSKSGEITAVKAAGINMYRILWIFFLIGIFTGILELGAREKVIPKTIKYAEELRLVKIKKDKKITIRDFDGLLVTIKPNARATIKKMIPDKGIMKGIVIDYFNDSFGLDSQIVSSNAEWQDGKWVFYNGVFRKFKKNVWVEDSFEKKVFDINLKPDDFILIKLRPEEMSTKEFLKYIAKLKLLGIPSDKERIQLHSRFAGVFSHIIVMLIGIPFALGFGSRHGKMISFSFALLFSFFYWGFQAAGQSLGVNGIIPIWLAAWLGNIIFAGLGIFALTKVKK